MTNKFNLIISIIMCLALFSCTENKSGHQNAKKDSTYVTAASKSNEWVFSKAVGSTLKFKNGKQYKTDLYELKYIGQVENGQKAPFLLFSGRDCNECDANISLYIHSPDDGHLDVTEGKNRFGLPGTERDFANESLIYKARAFYGTVLPGIKGAIWYQQQLMEDGNLEKSVFLVNLNKDHKIETTTKGSGKIDETLQLLNQGLCKEITGVDYKSEP